MERAHDDVSTDVLGRLDRDGSVAQSADVFEELLRTPQGRSLLRLTGVAPEEVAGLVGQQRALIQDAARSALIFGPLGWAPSGLTPAATVAQALAVLDETGSPDQAEEVLVSGWNDSGMLKFCWSRLHGLGIGNNELGAFFAERARLIEKALEHHNAGAFEASVPIVLAQIEGVVFDMTQGKSGFFSRKGDSTHLRDSSPSLGWTKASRPSK